MKAYQLGPTVTIVATEAITKRRFVTVLGKHTADKHPAGVSLFDTDSGDSITVQTGGIAVVEAGGAITAGDPLSADANGKAVSLTIDNVNDIEKYGATSLDAASGAGEFIRVILH